MIDSDLSSLQETALEALYGGPPIASAKLAWLLKQHGITLPCVVLCAEPSRAMNTAWAAVPKVRFLSLHPGLVFCHLPTRSVHVALRDLERASVHHGQPQRCANARQWITAARKAVVTLREQELTRLFGPRVDALTLLDEQQLRRVALQQVRSGQRDWPQALALWTECVLWRHRGQLNSVRRKSVEFMVGLTQSIDNRTDLGFPFWQGLRRLDRTFCLSHFPQVMRDIVAALEPHVVDVDPMLSAENTSSSELVARALTHLRQHFREPLSTAQLAAHLGVTPEHLARRFKKHVNRSPIDFLHALRINQAQRLLLETPDNVLEIALSAGFGSVEHFHRIFRRTTGLTPAQYRRRARE